MSERSRIFYIMGKSSSGKDTILKMLISELGLQPIVLFTTRPRREGEHEGAEYHFCTEDEWMRRKMNGSIIEERIYNTNQGKWIYFTDRCCFEADDEDYIGIGTLESYSQICDKMAEKQIIPLYIYIEDPIRLERAIERERNQKSPDYKELCRRFIADEEDFSEKKLSSLNINNRFDNSSDIKLCFNSIKEFIEKCRH